MHFHGLHSKRMRRTSWLLTFYSIPEFLFLNKWITNISTAQYILESSFRKRKVKSLCCVWLFETPWTQTPRTVACQAPPFMGFSRQEHRSGLPCPSPGVLPNTGTKPRSPALQAHSLWYEPPEKPRKFFHVSLNWFLYELYEKSSAGIFDSHFTDVKTSLVAQTVKRLPTMRETRVQSLGGEDPLEKEMATHSSTLAWKILWEEPGRLQSMGSQKSLTRLRNFTFFHFHLQM